MGWTFRDDRPIWVQLTERLTLRIVSGDYAPGAALPAVRTLAAEAGVNPNTMQRAMAELENQGLAESKRTAGRTVTENLELIQEKRQMLAQDRIQEFLRSMRALGYTDEQTKTMISQQQSEDRL